MKKNGLLNSELAKLVADLRHTDRVCIGDLGLPVPTGIAKIDLSLKHGQPNFQDVLDEYLKHVLIEKVILAEEIKTENPQQLSDTLMKLDKEVVV